MIGEYIRDGKAHQVGFAGVAEEAPRTLTVSFRSCPKSPALEIDLEFIGVDTRRNVALYHIVGERQKN